MAAPLLDAGGASAVCSKEHNLPAAGVLHRRPTPANYQPKTWDYDSISSMHLHGQNKPSEESSLLQLASLKQRVRQQLLLEEEEEADELSNKLRIIDQLQSLGVAYHFEEEIKSILTSMHVHEAHLQLKHDLSSTALLFRMLRAHGIPASTDMLSAFFTDGNGALEAAGNINLMRDNDDTIDGLVALYEASYLAFPGEAMLDTAREFAMDRLQQQMTPSSMVGGSNLQEDLPLHLRAPRLQAIQSLKYHSGNGGGKETDPCIVQLAAEDFNKVQAVHRSELVELTRWWKETKLGEKLPPSARDRLVECFFCAACIAPEPRLAGCRDVLAKVGSLIVHLDDIYDVYGTLHELATFTDAIAGNWNDDSATALLPEYMKAMLSAIRSTSTAAADRVLGEHGHDVLPLYKKAWHQLCEAFMVEAKWQHERIMPGLDEYLDNGWVTSTGPLLLLHALTMLPSSDQQEQHRVDTWLPEGNGKVVYPRLVEICSRIFRLCNDCATHEAESERREGPSSIACLMSESGGGGATKEEARGAVADAIAVIWKQVNRELLTGSVDAATGVMCVNLARVIQCIYHDGDGITSPTDSRKQLVKDLLFTPLRTLL